MYFNKDLFIRIRIGSIYTVVERLNSTPSSAEYCMNLVKKHDYENFVCTLLLKNDCRPCAFAVRSFNVEVARIVEQVSQKETGLMRFQFWEDTLDSCFNNELDRIPRHPVALELFKSIKKYRLSRRNLKNLLNSRKQHMNINGFNSLDDVEKYSENSVSSVYYSILEGCGVKNVNADHAASHLGKAQGIVQLLRTVPMSKTLNFIPLPQAILSKNNVSQEELLRCIPSNKMNDCIYEVASRAHQHLMKSRSLRESVPSEGRQALLPAIAVFSYLDILQKVNYDIFHTRLKQKRWNLLLQLWFSNLKNTY